MASHLFTVSQAASQLATRPSTVRRWCADFAAHLSPAASPPSGQQRMLSDRDIDVLREVAMLRSSGLPPAVINERLAGIVFADTAIDLPQPAQEAHKRP